MHAPAAPTTGQVSGCQKRWNCPIPTAVITAVFTPGTSRSSSRATLERGQRQQAPVAGHERQEQDRPQHVAALEHRRPRVHEQRPAAVQQKLVGVRQHRVAVAAADRDRPDPGRHERRQRRRPGQGERGRAHLAAAREPRPRQQPRRQHQGGDGVGRVHERDRHQRGRGRRRRPADAADLEQEQDQHRGRQHPDAERRRLVDLDDEAVQERAQVPGDEDGHEHPHPAPASERPPQGVGARDRKRRADGLDVAERRHRIGAREPGHAGDGRVHDRERVAGVRRAVQERREARERDPADGLELADQADVEEPVADDRAATAASPDRRRRRSRRPRRRSHGAPPAGSAHGRRAHAARIAISPATPPSTNPSGRSNR